MIIKTLLNLIYTVLSKLLIFELPALPDSILSIMYQVLHYVYTGICVLGSFLGSTCMGVLALLLQLVIVMHSAYMTYTLVFWVLRKIPMLNVRE